MLYKQIENRSRLTVTHFFNPYNEKKYIAINPLITFHVPVNQGRKRKTYFMLIYNVKNLLSNLPKQ